MKLLVRGDDFGFTRGVTYGILEGIDHGILTATGMFANMEIAPWAAQFIKERKEFCFGIDFNIVSGPAVSPASEIPHLVDQSGSFIRSTVRVADPRFLTAAGRAELFPYPEVLQELQAQYARFVALTGRKPCYLHAHSIQSENYIRAIREISQAEGIPFSQDIQEKYHFVSSHQKPMGKGPIKKVFDQIAQLNKDTVQQVMASSQRLLSSDYALIGGHPGYVDADLLKLTTLSLERCKDLEMIVSPVIRQWVQENQIELISYRDLK